MYFYNFHFLRMKPKQELWLFSMPRLFSQRITSHLASFFSWLVVISKSIKECGSIFMPPKYKCLKKQTLVKYCFLNKVVMHW